MSQENVEIVHRFVDAYNQRDPEAVAAFPPRGRVAHVAAPIFGIEVIHGRDRVLRFGFEQIPEAMDDFRLTIEEVSELPGGPVLGVGRYEDRGVASGPRSR